MKKIILCCALIATIGATHAQLSGYRITSARVTIRTGNDNKEFGSKVEVYLFPIPAATYSKVIALGQKNLTNEMKVNSNTEFGLTVLTKQKIPWPDYNNENSVFKKNTDKRFTSGTTPWLVEDLQKQGFRLLISYRPLFNLDAWKIDRVTVKLEVKKTDGTPHPTLNNKTIVFNITSPPLGSITGWTLVCEADKDLVPLTHYLTFNVNLPK